MMISGLDREAKQMDRRLVPVKGSSSRPGQEAQAHALLGRGQQFACPAFFCFAVGGDRTLLLRAASNGGTSAFPPVHDLR